MSENGKGWQVVHRLLQRDIISGHLHPRERLVEDEIIARTQATRHAVRLAFIELEKTGLIIRERNKGVHVRDYSIQEIEELYEIRECLEGQAAKHFTKPVPETLIEALTKIAGGHREASRNQHFDTVFDLNNKFHEMLYKAAGNRQLAEAIQHYTFATHPIRTRAFPNEEIREIAIDEHFRMIDALAANDTDRLRNLIVAHMRRPKDYYLKANYIGAFEHQ